MNSRIFLERPLWISFPSIFSTPLSATTRPPRKDVIAFGKSTSGSITDHAEPFIKASLMRLKLGCDDGMAFGMKSGPVTVIDEAVIIAGTVVILLMSFLKQKFRVRSQ